MKQYVALKEGDILQDGDEYYLWSDTSGFLPIPKSFYGTKLGCSSSRFRRPIKDDKVDVYETATPTCNCQWLEEQVAIQATLISALTQQLKELK